MLFSGLGVFLLGMKLVSSHLQNLAGGKVNKMLAKISGNKLAGIGLGAGAAMLLESSSATTVLLLSLVDAGIVSLLQATLIIMGANIGTTVTVVLFSLNYLPVGEIIAFLTLVGAALVMGGKTDKTKTVGWVVASVGLIFVGLHVMSDGVDSMRASQSFITAIGAMKNPFVLVLFGVVFTAIIQSGSATTGILIALCSAGIMPVTSAFCIIAGSNIGSCMTAIIASFGANLNAKRTAFIHLIFNVAGAVLFMPLIIVFGNKVSDYLDGKLSPAVTLAYFHVLFNVVTTLILLPLVKKLVKLAEIVLPEEKRQKGKRKFLIRKGNNI